MGLPVSLLARGDASSSPAAAAAVEQVYTELRHVDAVFSPYKQDSQVSRLGRGELAWEDCDPEVVAVAARCEAARERTGGLFDARRPDGTWDPSGLVKGWAAERATRHLAAVPGLDWCLNAGGDVAVLCPSGEPFAVGIQDPRDPARVAAVVRRSAGAVATSGTAVRGAHLYDPRGGGAAAATWSSVTVVGDSLETADVLATAAFVAGHGWLEVLARAAGYEALALAPDGSPVTTPGWPGTGQGRLGA
jgi:thiamine biosynthesis lipoprotein